MIKSLLILLTIFFFFSTISCSDSTKTENDEAIVPDVDSLGIEIAEDINKTPASLDPGSDSSYPANFTQSGDSLYFSVIDNYYGSELLILHHQ